MRKFIKVKSPMFALLLVVTALLGIAGASIMPKAYAADSGERLIMIHDREAEHGLITKATTLRDVFREAGIRLDKNDRVEPGLDEPLVASSYQVNVYRARPVVIVDGPVKQLVMSAYQTPKQIAQHAGIKLRDEDVADVDVTNDFISDGASLRMSVDRAMPVALNLYGKTETVYTQATTVEEFLDEKSIELGKNDDMSLRPTDTLKKGIKFKIWRNGKQTITQEEAVKFEVEKIQDANRPVGYRQVDEPGKNGKRMVTYEIIMRNGEEVSRVEIQSVVTEKPVKQVETVGTKVNLPSGSHEDWMKAAGISAGDYGYVNYIVGREGGWEPCKVYGGSIDCSSPATGPYGMLQANPGTKMSSAGADWRTNPVTQLRWGSSYAVGRYGSWKAAYEYWIVNNHW